MAMSVMATGKKYAFMQHDKALYVSLIVIKIDSEVCQLNHLFHATAMWYACRTCIAGLSPGY